MASSEMKSWSARKGLGRKDRWVVKAPWTRYRKRFLPYSFQQKTFSGSEEENCFTLEIRSSYQPGISLSEGDQQLPQAGTVCFCNQCM